MDFARRQEDGTCGAQLVVMDDGQKIVHTCTDPRNHTRDHSVHYRASVTNPIAVWVIWTKES